VETVVGSDGSLRNSDIYRACVRNRAKLAYNCVAAWLEGGGKMPDAVAAVPGLDENLRIQDRAAERMKELRQVHGALSFESLEARPIFDGDTIRGLEVEKPNRAKDLIADFMIAANGVAPAICRHGNSLPCGVWFGRRNDGTGLSNLPGNTDSSSPMNRIQDRRRSSW
jgi:exoribonuclease-2